MQLELPIPGVTPGPDWALMINQAFYRIDSHDHKFGRGKLVPSTAIVFSGDVDMADGDNAYGISRAKYFSYTDLYDTSQGVPGVAGSLFRYKGDLWYQYNSTGPGSGAFAQITSYNRVVSTTTGFEPINIESSSYLIGQLEKISALFVDSQPTTINLPFTGNVGNGRYYLIQDRTGTANSNNITITPESTDAIGTGTVGSSVTISTSYGYKWLIADATGDRWLILTEN